MQNGFISKFKSVSVENVTKIFSFEIFFLYVGILIETNSKWKSFQKLGAKDFRSKVEFMAGLSCWWSILTAWLLLTSFEQLQKKEMESVKENALKMEKSREEKTLRRVNRKKVKKEKDGDSERLARWALRRKAEKDA